MAALTNLHCHVSDPNRTHARSRRCPDCRGRIRRILRNDNDRRRWDAEQWHRYACSRCAWQGLMPTRQRERTRPLLGSLRTALAPVRLGRAMVLMMLAGLIGASGLYVLQLMLAG